MKPVKVFVLFVVLMFTSFLGFMLGYLMGVSK